MLVTVDLMHYVHYTSPIHFLCMHVYTVPGEFLNSSIAISVLFNTSLTPIVSISIEVYINFGNCYCLPF